MADEFKMDEREVLWRRQLGSMNPWPAFVVKYLFKALDVARSAQEVAEAEIERHKETHNRYINFVHRAMGDLGDPIAEAVGYSGLKDGDALLDAVKRCVAERDAAQAALAEARHCKRPPRRTSRLRPATYQAAYRSCTGCRDALRADLARVTQENEQLNECLALKDMELETWRGRSTAFADAINQAQHVAEAERVLKQAQFALCAVPTTVRDHHWWDAVRRPVLDAVDLLLKQLAAASGAREGNNG